MRGARYFFRWLQRNEAIVRVTVPLDDGEVARGGARAPPRPGGGGAGTPGRREGVVARTLSVREKSGVRADPNARGGERQSGAQFLRARETASKCNSDSDAAKETLTRPRSTRAAHTRREMESTAQIRRAAPCPRAHRAPPALPLRDPSRGRRRRAPPEALEHSRRNIDLLFQSHSPQASPLEAVDISMDVAKHIGAVASWVYYK